MKFPIIPLSWIEIALLVVFIVYILFPVSTPAGLSYYVDSPLGIVAILLVAVYLFFFSHPVLGVIYLWVAYELLRRSAAITTRIPMIQYVPSEKKRMREMVKMNPPVYTTLEEEIVAKNGHVDVSRPLLYEKPSFKPVAENVMGASLI
jgi:hypothetical protein